jgi:hypothetical protein
LHRQGGSLVGQLLPGEVHTVNFKPLGRRRSPTSQAEQPGELAGQLRDVLASTLCYFSAAGDGRVANLRSCSRPPTS